ncbi:MAG: DUF58 domain-containing protein [Spirochaetaceae bacterium]|nr:DUF58 domain-containing protein [Spirochaetaceae bacterium]
MKAPELKADSLLRRANALRLSSKIISDGIRAGAFRSVYRGRGIEFSGVREYLRGDDVRSIDWNVTARMGKTFVKQFEEDRELILFLVVDASLSMQTGSSQKSRLYSALEIAALTAFAATHTNSPVGCVVFAKDILFGVEPKASHDQVLLLLSHFDNVLKSSYADKVERNTGSALGKALKGTAKMLKKRSLVLVISDFRTTGYEKPLAVLCTKHDVVAVRITDSCDLELPEIGTVPFVDAESGFVQRFPTNAASFRREWREEGRQRLERWRGICSRRGAVPLEISTDEDVAQKLQQFFSLKELK